MTNKEDIKVPEKKKERKSLSIRYPDPLKPSYVNIASFQKNQFEFVMDLGIIDNNEKRDQKVADITHRFVMSNDFLETFVNTLNNVYKKDKK